MKVELAFKVNETRKITFQEEFPKVTECCRCKGKARLGFVAHEYDELVSGKGGKYVCDLYENDPNGGGLGEENPKHKGKGYWLHDACCVAVYFCRKCLEPTALYNQA